MRTASQGIFFVESCEVHTAFVCAAAPGKGSAHCLGCKSLVVNLYCDMDVSLCRSLPSRFLPTVHTVPRIGIIDSRFGLEYEA